MSLRFLPIYIKSHFPIRWFPSDFRSPLMATWDSNLLQDVVSCWSVWEFRHWKIGKQNVCSQSGIEACSDSAAMCANSRKIASFRNCLPTSSKELLFLDANLRNLRFMSTSVIANFKIRWICFEIIYSQRTFM